MERWQVARRQIGLEYVARRFKDENSEQVRANYSLISDINRRLFELIPFNVQFTNDDPYSSAKDMREQVAATGNIRIYTDWSGHPFLTHEENNVSRAVHDVWAHLVCGCPFTFVGEYSAYLTQREHYPRELWPTLFTEIPAQTAAYYFLGGFDYRQRAFEAPAHWVELCKGIEEDYSKNAIIGGIAI